MLCLLQQSDCSAIPVNGADVHIRRPRLHSDSAAALKEVSIDQGSDELVLALPVDPKSVQLVEHAAGHLKCAPDPARRRIRLFHLDFDNSLGLIEHYRIEKLRLVDREEKEGEKFVRQ